MLLLDANVLSAMMQLRRVPGMAVGIGQQDEHLRFTTAISHAEIFSGLALMPAGRRRRNLETTARAMFAAFDERVLPFDTVAADAYAALFAIRRQAGRPIASADLTIAAIARARAASIVHGAQPKATFGAA
jgi:predicted nucleic acid-binding protein